MSQFGGMSESGLRLELDGKQPTNAKLDQLAALDYTGHALEGLRLNAAETELEFAAGGGAIEVLDEGVSETAGLVSLDFTGAGVTATDDGSGNVEVAIALGSGNLIGKQIISATGGGTYTPTAGTNAIELELIGAGGGGGSVGASPGAGLLNVARGGGAGAHLRKRLLANFSGASYSVGTGGAGGASGGTNAGSNGGNTTFTDTAGSPVTYTAGGGTGGSVVAGTTPPGTVGSHTQGGTATNGDLNIPGQIAVPWIVLDDNSGIGGCGGNGQYGASGRGGCVFTSNSTSVGNAGTGFGSGGGGAVNCGTGGTSAGGAGANGLIIIWEYGGA